MGWMVDGMVLLPLMGRSNRSSSLDRRDTTLPMI